VAEAALYPSEEAKRVSWRASLGFVARGAVINVIVGALLTIAPPIQTWGYIRDAFDLPGRLVAIAHFTWSAVGEEFAKALGAQSARLTSNRLSWWGVAALIGGSFGLLERFLYLMNWTPEFWRASRP
jgi:hypothetical protein